MNFNVRVLLMPLVTIIWTLPAGAQEKTYTIPLGGNAFSNKGIEDRGGKIDNAGIDAWTDKQVFFDVYFHTAHSGSIHLSLNIAVPDGQSRLSISCPEPANAGQIKELAVKGAPITKYDAGSWNISDSGYHHIRIQGIVKTGNYFAGIPSIEIREMGTAMDLAFVPNNDGNFFHWGRRGPSVHLNYTLPEKIHAEWFYNEVTVPAGQDIQGSYFMADGFGQGYFGMQVNSPTERHILFSVWSPYETDNPAAIPDSQRILLVKKGDAVHAGEFGNEGAGGQSWLNYPWKAGTSYRFLLRAQPIEHAYTRFTAWFYAPEEGKWRLIASFSRPQTQVWLGRLHSFLENFEPDNGDRRRAVFFSHQWVRDETGHWIPLYKAKFTGDNTARKGYRMDYAGGVRGNAFFLTNGGFFNDYSRLDQALQREAGSDEAAPVIDLDQLP